MIEVLKSLAHWCHCTWESNKETDRSCLVFTRGPRADAAELPQSGRLVRPEAAATGGRAGWGPAPGRGSLSEGEGAEGGAPEAAAGGIAAAESTKKGTPDRRHTRVTVFHISANGISLPAEFDSCPICWAYRFLILEVLSFDLTLRV